MDEQIQPEQPLEEASEKKRVARRSVLLGGVGGLFAGLLARVRSAEASHVPAAPVVMEEINFPPHGERTSLLGPFTWAGLADQDGASVLVDRPALGQVWDLQTLADPLTVPVVPATLEVVTDHPGVTSLVVHQRGTAGEPAAVLSGGPVDAQEVRCQDLTVGRNFSCGSVGSAVCPAGTNSCTVQSSVCTPDSYVGAICTADIPRNSIRSVVPGTGQFTVLWFRELRDPAPITFVVVGSVQGL